MKLKLMICYMKCLSFLKNIYNHSWCNYFWLNKKTFNKLKLHLYFLLFIGVFKQKLSEWRGVVFLKRS